MRKDRELVCEAPQKEDLNNFNGLTYNPERNPQIVIKPTTV